MSNSLRYLLFSTWFSAWFAVMCLGCNSQPPDQASPPEKDGAPTVENPVREQTAPAATDAHAVIVAAIEALGGEANFAKANIGRTTMEIEGAFQPGLTGTFTKVDTFQMPGQLKRAITGRTAGQDIDIRYVFDGDKGWMQVNGGEPVDVPMNAPITQTFPGDSLQAILALTSEDVQLTVTPEDQFNGQPVVCVRMDREGQLLGNTYFHKQTKLIVASTQAIPDQATGQTRSLERLFADYKDVNGLNIPMAMEARLDGETTMTVKVTEVTFMETIDAQEFARPTASQ